MYAQLYVPESGKPLFDTNVPLLIAGFSHIGAAGTPSLRTFGVLAEPWLPGRRPYFDGARSGLRSLELLPRSVIRRTNVIHEFRTARRVVGILQRSGADVYGLSTYLIAQDIDGIGQMFSTLFTGLKEGNPTTSSAFFFDLHALQSDVAAVMTEIRNQIVIRQSGFLA